MDQLSKGKCYIMEALLCYFGFFTHQMLHSVV